MAGEPMELFAGGEAECFTMRVGTPAVFGTAGFFDPAFSDCALYARDRVYYGRFTDTAGDSATVSDGDVLYGMIYCSYSGGAGVNLLTVEDVNARPAFRMAFTNPTTVVLQHNVSGTSTPSWTTLLTYTVGATATNYYNFEFTTGPTKSCALFVGGSEMGRINFTNSAIAALSGFTTGSTELTNSYVSQIGFNKNLSNVGGRIWTRKANAAGALSQMTGAYTALAKTAIDDTTAVVSDTAGQVSTFGYQNITDLTGLVAGGVHVWTRAKNDGTAPENLKVVCRIGSSNYPSDNITMSGGFGSSLARFPVNPATSASWATSTFNAAEFGLQSAP